MGGYRVISITNKRRESKGFTLFIFCERLWPGMNPLSLPFQPINTQQEDPEKQHPHAPKQHGV
jgi:hypothetical protein